MSVVKSEWKLHGAAAFSVASTATVCVCIQKGSFSTFMCSWSFYVQSPVCIASTLEAMNWEAAKKWFSAFISACKRQPVTHTRSSPAFRFQLLEMDWLSSFSSNKQSLKEQHQKRKKNGREESWPHKPRRLCHHSSTKVPREGQRWVYTYVSWSLAVKSMLTLQMHRQIHQHSSHGNTGKCNVIEHPEGAGLCCW